MQLIYFCNAMKQQSNRKAIFSEAVSEVKMINSPNQET